MSDPTPDTQAEARRLAARIDAMYARPDISFEQAWNLVAPLIAAALQAAHERGRKAGLEEARRMANERLEAWRLAPKSLGHSVNPTGLLELHRNDLIRKLKETRP